MRARSEQRRARLMVAVLLGCGVLVGCHGDGHSEVPEAKGSGSSLTWVAGQGETDPKADPDDDGSDDLRCREDPEARGCPWDREANRFGDEGVWGNTDPSTLPLPEPELERCPDSAVMGQMIEIPAGEFEMGCDVRNSELCGQAERKLTTVNVAAFSIDRTEVTQAAYQRCVEAGRCSAPAGGFHPREACTNPVVNVSWEEAGQYCAWLDRRLPTEAEWEKAARGTDGRLFPWGDEEPTCELANFKECGLFATEPVASHPKGASPYGLMDMSGNVREWIQDREESRARQPKRGIRGGMFTDQATHIRAVRRSWGDVNVSDVGIGFRCAK